MSAVMSLYEHAQTVVRTANGDSESFEVKVGLHQGSVLSPLLFIIVMEVITAEIRDGLPWELLYADDIVLMDLDKERLVQKIQRWKQCLENKGLKMNFGKTKIMKSCKDTECQEEVGKDPCGVCRKGVGVNSILKLLKTDPQKVQWNKGKLVKTLICIYMQEVS